MAATGARVTFINCVIAVPTPGFVNSHRIGNTFSDAELYDMRMRIKERTTIQICLDDLTNRFHCNEMF